MPDVKPLNRRFTLAPMMEWSTSDCRTFWRMLTRESVMYSEMVTSGALLHGDKKRFLHFNECEHPLALQLGGSNPKDLAECAKIAQDWGYDEVNLNCGCPSDRVQNGMIGACLMAEPTLVAECIDAMINAVQIPITVKHRIGIDDMDDYADMLTFVDTIATTGCNTFIVHARKAWLKGLSPKENREVPPLNYENVIRLKKERPQLEIIINGGIKTLDQAQVLLESVDGVMIGREAYSNPYMLAEVDQQIYGSTAPVTSRDEVMSQFIAFCEQELASGTKLNHLTRHILGLYQGLPGARQFRRVISENAHKPNAGIDVLISALAALNEIK
jgi:tRNA-dihydrouridine synthase A